MHVWLAVVLGGVAVAAPAVAQEVAHDQGLEARVWLDRGSEPVLDRGDRVRIYYRTSVDAYAAIFHIDTDGEISLVFPERPASPSEVRGGRDFRLLFDAAGVWTVREDPGVGNYFMVASGRPLDFSRFLDGPGRNWDLSAIGDHIQEDPYLAIDEYVAALIPDWEVAEYALDFIEYSVGESHDYPRYLCYGCHEQRSYAAWNPYTYACPTIRVVLWDDPYFYPAVRYRDSRVVFPQPLRQRPRYGVATRGSRETWTPLVRTREAPRSTSVAVRYKELPSARQAAPRDAIRRPAAGASTEKRRVGASRGSAGASAARRRTPTAGKAVPTRRATPRRSVTGAIGRGGARSVRPSTTRATSSTTRVTPANGNRRSATRRGTAGNSGSETSGRSTTRLGTAVRRAAGAVRGARPSAGRNPRVTSGRPSSGVRARSPDRARRGAEPRRTTRGVPSTRTTRPSSTRRPVVPSSRNRPSVAPRARAAPRGRATTGRRSGASRSRPGARPTRTAAPRGGGGAAARSRPAVPRRGTSSSARPRPTRPRRRGG